MAYPPVPADTGALQPLPHATINAILAPLRQCISDIGAVQSSITAAQASLATQATAITTLQNSITAVQASLTAQAASITALQTSLNTQADAIATLQTQTGIATPIAPQFLQQTSSTTTTLTVAWTAVAGASIAYIPEILMGSTWTVLPSTAATTYTFSGLVADTPYSVRVHAVDSGTMPGPLSSTLALRTATAITLPAAPSNLHVVGTPATASITVAWDAVPGATSYTAGYLVGGVWTAFVSTATTSATFTGLTDATAYVISVKAISAAGTGPGAGAITVTTATAGTPPATPTGATLSNATANSLDFTWVPLSGGGSPPADPGIALPSLSIAPGASHTFTNIAIVDTLYANTPNEQALNLSCAAGATISVVLAGAARIAGGANNSNYVQVFGPFQDLLKVLPAITYHAPGAAGSDGIYTEHWDDGGRLQSGTIAITVTPGATVETGGYNPSPSQGVTYVASSSGDAGSTWVSLPPVTLPPVTFGSLTASHSYTGRVHAISALGVSGSESTTSAAVSTLAVGTGGVIGDPTGTQAVRAADFCSSWGFTIYPNTGQDGGAVSEYVGQINYVFGGTGHRPIVRCYTDPGGAFLSVCQNLIAQCGVFVLPSVDHYQGYNEQGAIDLAIALGVANVPFVGGINEPNTADFGLLTPAQVIAAEEHCYSVLHPLGFKLVGSSVIYNCQDQANWWNAGGLLARHLAAIDYNDTHLYPNHGCYNASNMLSDWTNWAVLGNKPGVMTETDSPIFNTQWEKDNYEAATGWHEMCGWAIGYFKRNLHAFVHFSMNDYSSAFNPGAGTQVVGLFRNSAATPHRYTTQLAALIRLLTDLGATARSFTTGKIDCVVTGMPAGSYVNSGGNLFWLQVSNGDFWGLLFNEQNQFSGATSTVHLAFATNCTLVEDYGITGTSGQQASKIVAPRSTWTNVKAVDIVLGTEFRAVRVRKPP